MLCALTVVWGSSFLFTKLAVAALPPEWVVSVRLGLGASVLLPMAWLLGRRRLRGGRLWGFLLLIAVFGNLLPFSLISWGQQSIDSGLAAILMAIMPLVTLGLAHWLIPNEALNRFRLGGFALGFLGVTVLIGPQAAASVGGEQGRVLPMLAVLAGACSYGLSAILARLRPASDALSTAGTVTLIAALLSVPFALGADSEPGAVRLTAAVVWALLFLGVLSTAGAMLIYFRLIHSAGPAFVSQLNYLIPLWAVALGIIAGGERPSLGHLLGLVLILGGVVLARCDPQRRQNAAS